MPPITVLIADSNAVLTACRRILHSERGIQIVGEARSGVEVITSAIQLKPDILFLDLNMSQGKADPLIPIIREKSPKTKTILLTDAALPEARILKALSLGARGYLDKKVLDNYLAKAVKAVADGEVWVPRRMVAKILDLLISLAPQKTRLF